MIDFATWPQLEDPGQAQRVFDKATGEYRVKLLDESLEFSFYAPGEPRYADFVLEVDVRRVGGADGIGYGLVFRRQARGANAQSVRYVFFITPQGLYSLFLYNGDGSVRQLRPLGPAPGILKVGNELNHLTVTCKGDRITLAANGKQLGEPLTGVPVTQAGEIGIYVLGADGAKTEVAYKNLQISPAP